MPHSNYLPPFPDDDAKWTENRFPDAAPFSSPFAPSAPANAFFEPRQANKSEQFTPIPQNKRALSTEPLSNIAGPIHDIATTQSLVSALQSTMTTKQTQKRPVVIPGAKKREQTMSRSKTPAQRMRLRMRYGIVLGILLLVLVTTLLSLAPLGGGQGSFSLFTSVMEWVGVQQQNQNIAGHMTGNPVVNAALSNLDLPRSQYVGIARQDAVDAGISPDYFVRQIYQESSFNPNAVSPAGAVGIAQFLPSTAAGLGINPWDPISALKGAARLMANSARIYGGDYAKALAAYNAGSGTVNYAVQVGGANWLNYLPAETRNYIRIIMGI